MTAPTVDITGSDLNFNAGTTITKSLTLGASATSVWVIAPYWSTSGSVGNITGITWNTVALTKVTSGTRGANAGTVEVWALAGPATGTHNMVTTFQSNANNGSLYYISFNNTPTTGGLGTLWADITLLTVVTSANSTLTVPNNTSNDALLDGVILAANVSPAMTAQTNRVQISTSSNGNGNGQGASSLTPGPTGNQVMNWTFASNEHAQTALRVLGTVAAGLPTGQESGVGGGDSASTTAMMR
jgi:hypothetical protein